jgi:hypothetical protein
LQLYCVAMLLRLRFVPLLLRNGPAKHLHEEKASCPSREKMCANQRQFTVGFCTVVSNKAWVTKVPSSEPVPRVELLLTDFDSPIDTEGLQ